MRRYHYTIVGPDIFVHVALVLLSIFPFCLLYGFWLSKFFYEIYQNLFLNTLLRSLYQTNLTIIGHGVSPGCLDWLILWFLSMLWGAIYMFPIIYVPYYFILFCPYSLNLSEVNWTASYKSFSCLLPLICCSGVDFVKTKISFICFSTFLKQLKRISTHAESFKLYPKTLSNISLKLSMQLFSALIFFGSSPLFPSFDWSLISLFVDDLLKIFVIFSYKDIVKNNFILILSYTNSYYNNMIMWLFSG